MLLRRRSRLFIFAIGKCGQGAVGLEERGEEDAFGLRREVRVQRDRGEQVREGAVDDADRAEVITRGKVRRGQRREAQAHAPGSRKGYQSCGSRSAFESFVGHARSRPSAVALSDEKELSRFHPVAS